MKNKMGKIVVGAFVMALCGVYACKNSSNNTIQQGQAADTNMPSTVIVEEEVISVEVDSIVPDTPSMPKTKPQKGKK